MTERDQRFSFALCADDYAIAPGVSRGIIEALAAGALTATSVMTTSPWWPDCAGALRPYSGQADIGLHLNLTTGTPLGPMPEFAPSGTFPTLGRLMLRMHGQPRTELTDEIDRQFDRFETVFGCAPDHIDGHQHVHVLGPIWRLVLAALKKRGWRSWVRDSGDHPMRILQRRSAIQKALCLAALAHDFRKQMLVNGLSGNDGFAGFSPFRPADDYARQFDHFLVAPGQRHLVMCHPGLVDDHLRLVDPVLETREHELRFLISAGFREVLARRGASLVRMSEL